MPQKCLNHANIDILLEEVGGETVPQRVWRHALLDSRGLAGATDGAAELAGGQRLDRVAAGKQPASRQQQAAPSPLPPPGPQQFEQLRRHHRVPILAPLATLDAQQHALGINIAAAARGISTEVQGRVCHRLRRRAARLGSSVTSSTLSTAGIRRGCGTTVSRRDKSGRSSVTVKKKRSAETELLMLGGSMPIRVWCSWNRRRSSAVAVSGERLMKAANDRTWRT